VLYPHPGTSSENDAGTEVQPPRSRVTNKGAVMAVVRVYHFWGVTSDRRRDFIGTIATAVSEAIKSFYLAKYPYSIDYSRVEMELVFPEDEGIPDNLSIGYLSLVANMLGGR
jgi:hypothetical protein